MISFNGIENSDHQHVLSDRKSPTILSPNRVAYPVKAMTSRFVTKMKNDKVIKGLASPP